MQVPRTQLTCQKIEGSIGLAALPWVTSFADIRGTEFGTSTTVSARLGWSDHALHVQAQIADRHHWANQTVHDSDVFEDNCFELFLDPDCDGHNYLEWEVNSLGTTLDLRMDRPYIFGGTRDDSWEVPGLKLDVQSDGHGSWQFTAVFPWADLGVKPEPGDVWLANLMRVEHPTLGDGVIDPSGETRYWVAQPTGVVDIHRPAQWATLHFVDTEAPTIQWAGDEPVARLVEMAGLDKRARSDGPGFHETIQSHGWAMQPNGLFNPVGG